MNDVDKIIKEYTVKSNTEADAQVVSENSQLKFNPAKKNTSERTYIPDSDYEEEENTDNYIDLAKKKIQNKLAVNTIIVFSLMFIWIAIFLLVLPRETYSDSEKRELATMPKFSVESFFEGKFTDGITEYYSDTVPFREAIKNIANTITDMYGVRVDDAKIHGVVIPPTNDDEDVFITTAQRTEPPVISEDDTSEITDVSDEVSTDTQTSLSPDQTIPNDIEEYDPNDDNKTDIVNNGILVLENQGLMLYGGGISSGTKYAGYINRYRQDLGSHVNIYSMVIPTAAEFYMPSEYAGYSKSQLSNLNNIINNLSPSVKVVDAYSALAAHTDEKIYMRTDHHWSSMGAYYAAQEFCKQAGVNFNADLSTQYDKVVINNYVGSLYGYTNDIALKNNPEDFIYYKPKNSYETTYYYYEYPNAPFKASLFNTKVSLALSYCVYMGGDNLVTRIETDVDNGRKLAIFKDSFGNALVPFMVGSFEEIHVLDIRYFPHNAIDYINYYGITDVLFANNIFAATSGLGGNLNVLRTQADYSGQAIWGEPIEVTTPATTTTTAPPPETTTTTPGISFGTGEQTSQTEMTTTTITTTQEPVVIIPA